MNIRRLRGWSFSVRARHPSCRAAFLVILALVVSSLPTPSGAQPSCQPDGDVDQNGSVTAADGLLAFRQALNSAQLSACQRTIADVFPQPSDPDGAVTAADAVCIFQAALGLPSCLDMPVPPANRPPVADAGLDRTAIENSLVALSGAGTDPDGTVAGYDWEQTGGTTVSLAGAASAVAMFTAPDVPADETLTFRLTVTDDDGASAADTVSVTVRAVNHPPVVNAGADQRVHGAAIVTLASTASDTDGTIVSYTWEQTGGKTVTLAGAASAVAVFTAPEVSADETLTFRLTVTDDDGASASDTVSVTVGGAVTESLSDAFGSSVSISGEAGRSEGSNVDASLEDAEPRHAGNSGGASVWWTWTAPQAGIYAFDTRGSDFDTLLAVYSGDSLDRLSEVASNDDIDAGANRRSAVRFTAQQGDVYHIAVDGYGGATGAVVLNWRWVSVPNAVTQFDDNVVVIGISGSLTTDPLDFREVAQAFYGKYEDNFDFLIFISNLSDDSLNEAVTYSGAYLRVRNAVDGIGLDLGTFWRVGSADRLKGIVHLPFYDGLEGGPALHEIMHTWANYAVPTARRAHWGFSNANGQLGGFDPADLVEHGPGKYSAGRFGTVANFGNSVPYSPIELYLAGLIPPSEVPDLWVANDGAWTDENDESGNPIFTASDIESYSIERIVSENGARDPDFSESQKDFRAALILLVDDMFPATTEALEELSAAVRRFAHPGRDESYLFNFWEATGGRATLTMDGLAQRPAGAVSTPSARAFAARMIPDRHEDPLDAGMHWCEGDHRMIVPETNGSVDPGEGE